jgi:hypothetical protein
MTAERSRCAAEVLARVKGREIAPVDSQPFDKPTEPAL